MLPVNKRPFGWVYGKAIPTKGKTVDEAHTEFLKEMERIFETYKKYFGYSEDERIEMVNVKETDKL